MINIVLMIATQSMITITHNLGGVARYADRVNVMYAGKIIESGTAHEIYHKPAHPYTLGLLHSVPRLDQSRKERLKPITGQPPDLTQLDSGCSFRPRCSFQVDQCANAFPSLETVEKGHITACWEREKLLEPAIACTIHAKQISASIVCPPQPKRWQRTSR